MAVGVLVAMKRLYAVPGLYIEQGLVDLWVMMICWDLI